MRGGGEHKFPGTFALKKCCLTNSSVRVLRETLLHFAKYYVVLLVLRGRKEYYWIVLLSGSVWSQWIEILMT